MRGKGVGNMTFTLMIKSKISSLIGGVGSGIKEFLGIKSPSKMMCWGPDTNKRRDT